MKLKRKIDQVSKIILVAAGKGGVGKSTISVALAEQLASQGARVGLADADIYGPSIPHMFGITEKPEVEDGKMLPILSRGIKIISIALLVNAGEAIVWRGPMANKAIFQLLSGVKWGELDYLIIDTPPGTGDIHISILENYHIDGVMIVTTPQRVAALDVNKAIDLYEKFDVPIMGIVENMSGAFSGNAGEEIARAAGVKLLAKIPLKPEIGANADEGRAISHLIGNLL